MRYGDLTVICGPMFSGKTTELLKRILWAKNGQHKRVKTFKPAFDVRYAKLDLVSHDGLAAPAEAIRYWNGIDDVDVVFFDEVQFFNEEHFDDDIVEVITNLLEKGIDVVCSGLDMDWKGVPFLNVAQLMAMAEHVKKMRGICAVCGRPSTRSYKKSQAGETIEIGSVDLYEPRCTHHWSKPEDGVIEFNDELPEMKFIF